MSKLWVDPPSGWQYGFPKIYDPAVETVPLGEEWLVKNGMPAEYCGMGIRCWNVDEEKELAKDQDA